MISRSLHARSLYFVACIFSFHPSLFLFLAVKHRENRIFSASLTVMAKQNVQQDFKNAPALFKQMYRLA
jgi:hypothetical protein